MRRSVLTVLLVLSLGLMASCGGCAATIDHWLWWVLAPGDFDAQAPPPAPDYASEGAWAALPSRHDAADVDLPELPAIGQEHAEAAVFYLHPTTSLGPRWNAPIDAPEVVEATARGGTLIQASVFNACCAVYAPRYRQAHGRAYTHPDPEGDRAIDLAFGDVTRAFDAFLERIDGAPFLVASHSQGTILGARLVRERIAGTALQERLVAAYLIGATVDGAAVGGVRLCSSADDVGCVVAFNARGPRYRPNQLEFDANDPDTMRRRACANPLSWHDPAAHVPASAHAGAVFFDTDTPRVKPSFADAQCVDGTLLVTELGDLERDGASRALLWITGPENYHPVEYQLFYVPLRTNAVRRVAAYADRAAPAARAGHEDGG